MVSWAVKSTAVQQPHKAPSWTASQAQISALWQTLGFITSRGTQTPACSQVASLGPKFESVFLGDTAILPVAPNKLGDLKRPEAMGLALKNGMLPLLHTN